MSSNDLDLKGLSDKHTINFAFSVLLSGGPIFIFEQYVCESWLPLGGVFLLSTLYSYVFLKISNCGFYGVWVGRLFHWLSVLYLGFSMYFVLCGAELYKNVFFGGWVAIYFLGFFMDAFYVRKK